MFEYEKQSKLMVLALLAVSLACNLPGSTAETPAADPDTPPAEQPATSAATASPTGLPVPTEEPLAGIFRWVVIVDLDSEPVSREKAQELVAQASLISIGLTGFGYEMVDFVEQNSPVSVQALAEDYIAAHADNLPNGIMIFSFGDGDAARTYGGYAFALPGPPGFRNVFVSPSEGDNKVYISVQHWSHRYARCGYGSSTAETPVQDTSLNGECRNQDGVACVEKYGYSMCSTAVNDLYASTATYFASTTIIHEIMHSFGDHGAMDHYGTSTCNDIMASGVSVWPYNLSGPFDQAEAQFYNQMCPYTYDNFVAGYQP